MSVEQTESYLSQLPSFIWTGQLDVSSSTHTSNCTQRAGQQLPLKKSVYTCCGCTACLKGGDALSMVLAHPVTAWRARVRNHWGHSRCAPHLRGSCCCATAWSHRSPPRLSKKAFLMVQKRILQVLKHASACARSHAALPEGWAWGGQTCLTGELQPACSAKPRVSLGWPFQKQTNWISGAASVTHGDPQAFPPSAGKLRCSLPKDTSMEGFVVFRLFFFTIHTHPRVHSTEILMITLSYCCFVGLTALKT